MEQRTGRIDRINSQCYFELKKEGKRNFNNSLQVFYPYLADTLEVNQVAKVFHKMNDFVQTFYDISVINEKDTLVSTDSIIKEIPAQIKDLLLSKYDHDNGYWPEYNGYTSLDLKNIGYNRTELIGHLEQELELLKAFNDFHVYPYVNYESLQIRANLILRGRRAPIRLNMIKGRSFDEILYAVESIIGKSTHQELRKKEIRSEIKSLLSSIGMELIENNDFLLVRKLMSFELDKEQKTLLITEVLTIADELEQKYTNEDEEVN